MSAVIRRPNASRWLLPLFVLTLTYSAFVAVLVGSDRESGSSVATLAVLQLGTAAAVLLVVRVRESRLDPLNPIVLIAGMFPLMYTLQLIIVSSGTDPLTSALAPWLQSQVDAQREAALIASGGLLCVLAGYMASTVIPVHPTVSEPARPRSVGVVWRSWLVAIVGIGLFMLLVITVGGPSNLLRNLYNRTQFFEGVNYLANGPLLMGAAVAALLCRRGAWPPSRATIALAGATMLVSLLTGSKTTLVLELVLWGAIVHQMHRRITWRQLAATVVILGVVLPFYDLYFRNAVPRGVPLGQVIQERGGLVPSLSRLAADTFFGEQALTIAVVEFPSTHGYTGFASVGALVLAPVPRAVFPSKPSAPSATFTDSFAPEFHAAGSTIPPTAMGEMYMSAGVGGVMFGCAALGFFAGSIYRRRAMGLGQTGLAALTTATVLLFIRGETYGVGVYYLFTLVPLLWIIRGNGEGRHFRRAAVGTPETQLLVERRQTL